jgi:CHRD domain-containing protein
MAIGGFQFAATSTFDQTISLTQSSIYNPTFLADGGSESVFLSALNAGLVYINVSDALNPGGEIRGQIEPPTTGGGGGGGGSSSANQAHCCPLRRAWPP